MNWFNIHKIILLVGSISLYFDTFAETEMIYEPSDSEVLSISDDLIMGNFLGYIPYEGTVQTCFNSVYKVSPSYSFRNNKSIENSIILVADPAKNLSLETGDEVLMLVLPYESDDFKHCNTPDSHIDINYRLVGHIATLFKIDRNKDLATTFSCKSRALFEKTEAEAEIEKMKKCSITQHSLHDLLKSAGTAFIQ